MRLMRVLLWAAVGIVVLWCLFIFFLKPQPEGNENATQTEQKQLMKEPNSGQYKELLSQMEETYKEEIASLRSQLQLERKKVAQLEQKSLIIETSAVQEENQEDNASQEEIQSDNQESDQSELGKQDDDGKKEENEKDIDGEDNNKNDNSEITTGQVETKKNEEALGFSLFKEQIISILEENPNDVPQIVKAWRRAKLDYHDIPLMHR